MRYYQRIHRLTHRYLASIASDDISCLDLGLLELGPDDDNDEISGAIEAFAAAERDRNFHFLARTARMWTSREALRVLCARPERITHSIHRWNLDPISLTDCVWYSFYQPFWKLEITVPIRYLTSDATGEVSINDMQVFDVQYTKSWMPLCDWMRMEFEWHDAREWKQDGGRQLQLDNQVFWWNSNGKHFPFLRLPAEMRELIYLEIIGGGIIVPQVRSSETAGSTITLGHGLLNGPMDGPGSKLDPDIDHPNPRILLVNRQVRVEATNTIWRRAVKRLNPTSNLTIYNIHQIRHHGHPGALNRIQLEMNAARYFKLIGITPSQWQPFGQTAATTVTIASLKALRTVKYLDFRFISPKHEHALCPWGAITPRPSAVAPWPGAITPWPGAITRSSIPTYHSCQRIWIDWFFTFALKQLRGWKCQWRDNDLKLVTRDVQITMSGCIKTSTRNKWEQIFKAVHDSGDSSLAYAMEAKKTEIMWRKRDSLPIKCDCTIPCYSAGAPQDGYQRFVHSDIRGRVVGLEEAIQENYFSFDD